MLDIRDVSKWFGAHQVLIDVHLEVGRGERVVVCGPSGSGKSTLVYCINGLEAYDAGEILVDGILVSEPLGTAHRLRRSIGMVFQRFNLFPHLTALENCSLGPRLVGRMSKAEAEARALACLERVRIPEQANKRPEQLSGGQQQRVAIARALAMQPRLMLFDEPTSALDPEMIKEVLDVMIELAEGGMTMIVVTHEMGFARRAADRIVFMDEGRIITAASPDTFFDRQDHPRVRQFLDDILQR